MESNTEKQLTEKELAQLKKNQERAEALDAIRNSVREYKEEIAKACTDAEIPDEVIANLEYIIGNKRSKKERVKKGRAPALKDVVRGLFTNVGDTKDEMEIFVELQIGRPEMQFRIVELIKKSEPANRPWITFTIPEGQRMGVYTLVAVGENPPEGWDGYVPTVKKADEPAF